MICHFTVSDRLADAKPVQAAIVLFAVFAATVANATVFATLGLFGRGVGLGRARGRRRSSPRRALLFFLTSSHWGRLSDRVGRAPVMVAGLAANGAVAVPVRWPLLCDRPERSCRTAAGARRSTACLRAASSRRPPPGHGRPSPPADKRAAGVALVGASVGIASIAGPILTAALIGFGLSGPCGRRRCASPRWRPACTLLGAARCTADSRYRSSAARIPSMASAPYLLAGLRHGRWASARCSRRRLSTSRIASDSRHADAIRQAKLSPRPTSPPARSSCRRSSSAACRGGRGGLLTVRAGDLPARHRRQPRGAHVRGG